MTLRTKILSLAGPLVVAVTWDTFILAARLAGILRTIRENPSLFNGAEAMANLEQALADHMAWQAEQERRAA